MLNRLAKYFGLYTQADVDSIRETAAERRILNLLADLQAIGIDFDKAKKKASLLAEKYSAKAEAIREEIEPVQKQLDELQDEYNKYYDLAYDINDALESLEDVL